VLPDLLRFHWLDLLQPIRLRAHSFFCMRLHIFLRCLSCYKCSIAITKLRYMNTIT
jgi:hypothetical protein